LASVVAEAYVKGVSTRRIDDVVQAMGIEGMSPSQVSRLSADLDVKVTEFRERPSTPVRIATCGSTPSPRRSVRAAGS
jgi:transposase-like protein